MKVEVQQPRRRWWAQLYVQVLVAIALGVAVGHFWPQSGAALKPLGDSFVKLIKMIIAPVIFLTLVTGIAGIRDLAEMGRVALKAFVYFLVVSTLALIVGLVVANTVQPGAGFGVDPATLDAGAVTDYAARAHESSIAGFLLGVIPTTLVSAFAQDNILQVLLVAILFGVAAVLVGKPADPLVELLERVNLVVFRIVALVMRLAPIGAFGAIAFTVGSYGPESLASLGRLVATFYLTSLLFVLVVLGAIAAAAGFSILKLIRYLKAELLLVLGTSSSESALPALLAKMEAAGCAKGVVGVTGAGFVTLAATLTIVPGVPVAGMALILGVDRFMSECRSLTNFIGNAVATIVVARWEGQLDRERLKRALDG